MVDGLSIIVSLLLLLVGVLVYRYSKGLFSISFLIMGYIGFLYLGSLHFYITQGHYTFIFVFFMSLFYLIGMLVANRLLEFKKKKVFSQSLKIYNPLNISVWKLSLIANFLISLVFSLYRVKMFGIPLFNKTWYSTGIGSTTGVYNRALWILGPGSFLIITLLCYGLYKAQGKQFFKSLMVLSFVAWIGFNLIEGGKAAAIMPFLLMLMVMFYANREVPPKFLIVVVLLAFFLASFVGTFWVNGFSLDNIFLLFWRRVTVNAASHLDYVIYNWAPTHSWQFGHTILLEVQRIIAQITLAPKQPLFNEIIGNLKGGYPINRVTGVSPEISLFGMGYANFGFLGGIFTALVLGVVVQWINIYLLSRKSMNVFSFAIWMDLAFSFTSLVRSGNILISIESFLITVIPPISLTLIVYLCLALPFPSTLKWKKS